MSDSTISGTRPERDLQWLSGYLQDARSLHSDFVRQVDRIQAGSLLFHYTDLNGLKGIVAEHDLWLTHALYCNDEAEVKLGINVARDQIHALLNQSQGIAPKKEYLEALNELLKEPPQEGVYICCFCEKGDELTQWRAYGANGNGVSVQIDPNAFVEYTGQQSFGFLAIWNVVYSPDRQQQIMRTALEQTYDRFSSLPPDQIVRKAKDVIDFFVPTFKHHGFSREDEWRMIFVPSPTVKPRYRAARDMLIPYFSLKDLVFSLGTISKETWSLPIRQVCIGPNRNRELSRACAQSLLSDNGYAYPVIASETPYRG